MKKLFTILGLAVLISSFNSVSAQHAGDLDLTFNGTGYFRYDFYGNTDVINDIAVQTDRKTVSVGVAFTAAWNVDLKVIRLNEDGTLDATFGDAGVVTYAPDGMTYYEAHAMAVTMLTDGKILVAGGVLTQGGNLNVLLIKLNADGSFDDTFGINGISQTALVNGNSIAYDVAIEQDGKILIAGQSDNADFRHAPTVARFNSDGSLDLTFATDGFTQLQVASSDNEYSSICLQSDGKIVVSGHFASSSWVYVTLIARYNTDGSLDSTFGTNGTAMVNLNDFDDEFFGMGINSNNEIIVGGFTIGMTSYDMVLMKYDQAGTLVTSFGDNGKVVYNPNNTTYNVTHDLVIQADDKIVAVGSSGDAAPNNNDWIILRFNDDGSLDNTFGTDGATTTEFFGEQDEVNAVALDGNDNIYVGGKTLNSSVGVRDFTVARYTNDLHVGIKRPGQSEFTISQTGNGIFKIYTTANAEIIEVYNVMGVNAGNYDLQSGVYNIDLSSKPAGVYMYRLIHNGNAIASGKLGVKF